MIESGIVEVKHDEDGEDSLAINEQALNEFKQKMQDSALDDFKQIDINSQLSQLNTIIDNVNQNLESMLDISFLDRGEIGVDEEQEKGIYDQFAGEINDAFENYIQKENDDSRLFYNSLENIQFGEHEEKIYQLLAALENGKVQGLIGNYKLAMNKGQSRREEAMRLAGI